MLPLVADPHAWASLATLTALEIVLGVDNIIFLSIAIAPLTPVRRTSARRIGLFLLTKGTREIHGLVEGEDAATRRAAASFLAVIVQIALFDLVFSIDSVVTAVGMAEHLSIMIGAVILAMLVMLAASGPASDFVNRHPTVKMLALSFLLLIGTALIADAAHFHIPRGYLYFAVAFSALVEALNQYAARRRRS